MPWLVSSANHRLLRPLDGPAEGYPGELGHYIPQKNRLMTCRSWECGWTPGKASAGPRYLLEKLLLGKSVDSPGNLGPAVMKLYHREMGGGDDLLLEAFLSLGTAQR